MRSLFFKIFFVFWAGFLVTGVSMGLLFLLLQSKPYSEHRVNNTREALALYGEAAVQILEQKGEAPLRAYADQMEQRNGMRTYLISPEGAPFIHRNMPPPMQRLARRAQQQGEIMHRIRGKRLFIAIPIAAPQYRGWTIAGEMAARPFNPLRFAFRNPELAILRWLIIISVIGILSFLLARSLTSSIRKLQDATRRFADGDLSVRVAPRLRSHDEIAALGQDFDFMAERIETLVSSQKRLLRDISHELRSPLARLNVALELARQRAGDEAQGPLDRIDRETERLNEMIGQLLNLTQLESGSCPKEDQAIDLHTLLASVVADAHFEASSDGCGVRLQQATDVTVRGSEELLHRAIENLVRNAIRHTAKGTDVEVSLQRVGEKAIIRIRDHGPGVPQQELERIFEPFYRVGLDRNRQNGGAGIGLAISERAVRLHGGEITAANAPDGGLKMTLALPL